MYQVFTLFLCISAKKIKKQDFFCWAHACIYARVSVKAYLLVRVDILRTTLSLPSVIEDCECTQEKPQKVGVCHSTPA